MLRINEFRKSISIMLVLAMVIANCMTVFLSSPVSAAMQVEFYVSPNGDDSSDGSLHNPFRTISRAREAVRAINSNMTCDIIVNLMGGTYSLESTINFDSGDSGTNGYNIIYRNYKNEKPVISGGKEITGWTLHDSGQNIYKANVDASDDFRQLWVNDTHAVRARSEGPPPGLTNVTGGYSTTDFSMQNWGNISDVEFTFSPQLWELQRVPLSSAAPGSPMLSTWFGNYCKISQDTTVARSGTASGLLSGRTNTWNGPMQDVTAGLLANGQGTYNISAYVKLSSGTDIAKIGFEIKHGAPAKWIESPPVEVNSTDWTLISAPVNVTWTGTLTTARLYVSTKNTKVNFNVDDASMKFNEEELLENGGFEEADPTSLIKMAQPAMGIVGSMHNGSQAKFVKFVENAYELMDQPGEWYLDKAADVLYYKQAAGQTMAGVTVEVPVVENLIELRGTLDSKVHNIRFSGIKFMLSNFLRPSTAAGHAYQQGNQAFLTLQDRQAWSNLTPDPGAIDMYAADSIVIDGCELTKLSGQGIVMYEGCSNNQIINSLIYNTADGAIQMGTEGPTIPHVINPPVEEQLLNNSIINNKIDNIGQDYWGTCAIYLAHPKGTVISHNEISHVPYTGIGFSAAGNSYTSTPTYSSDTIISYNYIHNYDEKLYDGAGIYTSWRSDNSKVFGNYINNNNPDIIAKIPAIEADKAKIVGGIYSDQGSSGWEHYYNVIDIPESLSQDSHLTPLILWSPIQNYINIHDNYVSSHNPGFVPGISPTNSWVNNVAYPNGEWPQEALEIIDNAGLIKKAVPPTVDMIFSMGNITLSGNSKIVGDTGTNVTEGGISFSGASIIEGDLLTGLQREYPLPLFPEFPELADKGNLTAGWWPEGPHVINESGYYGSIDVKNQLTVNVGDEDLQIVTDNLTVDGSGSIVVNRSGTGRLILYVANQLKIAGSGQINHGGGYNDVFIYYSGNDAFDLGGKTEYAGLIFTLNSDVAVSGSGSITGHIITGGNNISITGNAKVNSGVVYAPNADLTLAGSSLIKGAAISRTMKLSGAAEIVYDGARNMDQFNQLNWEER